MFYNLAVMRRFSATSPNTGSNCNEIVVPKNKLNTPITIPSSCIGKGLRFLGNLNDANHEAAADIEPDFAAEFGLYETVIEVAQVRLLDLSAAAGDEVEIE